MLLSKTDKPPSHPTTKPVSTFSVFYFPLVPTDEHGTLVFLSGPGFIQLPVVIILSRIHMYCTLERLS